MSVLLLVQWTWTVPITNKNRDIPSPSYRKETNNYQDLTALFTILDNEFKSQIEITTVNIKNGTAVLKEITDNIRDTNFTILKKADVRNRLKEYSDLLLAFDDNFEDARNGISTMYEGFQYEIQEAKSVLGAMEANLVVIKKDLESHRLILEMKQREKMIQKIDLNEANSELGKWRYKKNKAWNEYVETKESADDWYYDYTYIK